MHQAVGRSRPWRDHRQVVEGIVFRIGPGWRGVTFRGTFNGFKHWRGQATRYDKHVIVYRGGLVLAAVAALAHDFGDTS